MVFLSCNATTLPTVTITRTDRRKARTVESILNGAEQAFEERGYAGSTMEQIAEEADVALGSIYRHFNGKEDLYLALVDRALEVNERHLQEAYAQASTPLARVIAASESYAQFHMAHPLYFRLVALRDLDSPERDALRPTRERIAARLEQMVAGLAEHIEQATAAGEIRAVDPHRAALFLWGAYNGAVALRARGAVDERGLAATLETGRDLLLRGLLPG